MSDNARSYALKDAVAERFAGGSLAYGADGETIDLEALLDEGGGTITTQDARLQAALERHVHFKRVGVPEGAGDADVPGDAGDGPTYEAVDPDDHTREQLDDMAESEVDDYDPDDHKTKADVAAAINAAREAAAEGGEAA